jgi:diguanylate cyclase (GGDEF)-like protein/PAS domain S-box-containing protein
MPKRPTLKWFFPLGLATLWLMFTALDTWHNLERRHAQVVQTARQDAHEHAAHLARMAEQGLQTNRLMVASDLAHISTDPRVSQALLLDEQGRILMAQRQAWVGQSVQQALPQLGDTWRQLATGSRLPQARASADELGLLVLHPYELLGSADEVRSSRRGTALVQVDLHHTWLQARHDTLLERLPSLLTALLLLLATGLLLQRHVAGPIGQLARAVGLLRQGQLGIRVQAHGPRELAELAADFNAMAQAIETAQHALATSEERLSVTLHSIGDGLIATDPRERITLMNPAAETFTGWTLAQALGHSIDEVFRIENAMTGQPAEIPVKRVLTEGTVLGLANHTVLIAKDGTRRHIADSAAPIRNAQGDIEGVVLVFHDETERHRMRLALADSEQHFRNLANSGQALIWTAGLDKKCDYFNLPWLRFTGRTLAQEMGNGWTEGVHPDDLDRCMVTYIQAFDARQPFAMEYRLRHASGDYRWILDQGNPRFDSQGHFLGYVGHCLDLTQVKQAEARVAHLAYHDTLTGLPNRALFHDRLNQALAAAQRNKHTGALMFIDLDHFKRVNDVYGHAVGDTVLREVSKRLQYFLRTEDSVARLGGDEFVVLLPALATDPHGAATLARVVGDKIRTALEAPIHIDGMAYHTAASIGVTLFPKGSQTLDDLMREADIAMYRAKEGGRNAVSFFQLEMQHSVTQRYELEQELRDAVTHKAFELYLQSQVNSAGHITGAEALVRWRHPTRGLVSPATFIPLAEETRLILPLGEWVLQQACEVIAQLGAAGHSLHIAVNVSPLQFAQEHFVQRVRDILATTGADPSYLTLEITEGLLVEHMAETMGRMSELATMGIRFSIDDFGTGYSSLAYLKRLPLYELKIDKSFVQDIPDDPNDVALVQTILAMAHHLHLSVVAEGVETAAQFELLKTNGCHRYQGYHFHRPQHHRDWLAALPPPAQR